MNGFRLNKKKSISNLLGIKKINKSGRVGAFNLAICSLGLKLRSQQSTMEDQILITKVAKISSLSSNFQARKIWKFNVHKKQSYYKIKQFSKRRGESTVAFPRLSLINLIYYYYYYIILYYRTVVFFFLNFFKEKFFCLI